MKEQVVDGEELDVTPDYKYWAKVDTWSLNQAAFILHGLNPLFDRIRSIRLGERGVPAELEEIQKTYNLLRKIPWQNRHPKYFYQKLGVHPAAVVYEACKKDLDVPKPLYKAIAKTSEYKRIEKENSDIATEPPENSKANNKKNLSTRERRNLLKTIGILVRLHFDEKNKSGLYNRGENKLNAYQIAQKLLEKSEALGVETKGLESLDRKITEALELLNEEM
jgi:hypothetical protein